MLKLRFNIKIRRNKMLGDGIDRLALEHFNEAQNCQINLNELKEEIRGCNDPDELWILKQRILRTKDRMKELNNKIKPN